MQPTRRALAAFVLMAGGLAPFPLVIAGAALAGLTAAVVGVVASVAVAFGRTVLLPQGFATPDWGAIAIATAAFAVVQWTRIDVLWVIAGGLVAGLALRFV